MRHPVSALAAHTRSTMSTPLTRPGTGLPARRIAHTTPDESGVTRSAVP